MSDAAPLSADDITWELVADLGPDDSNLDVVDIPIVALEEAQSYRILAQQAVQLLHVQDIQLQQLRAQYHQLLEQSRQRRPLRTKVKQRLAR